MLPICSLLLLATFASHNMAILEKTGQADLEAVRIRLEEEKAKRLLLENDVEVLMLQVEELRRGFSQISKDKMGPSGNVTLITPSIAFTATSTQTTMRSSPEQTVIFDNVKVNEGNCYNSSTGRFRAPFNGLYIFSVTVVRGRSDVQLLIMKDNVELVSVFFGRSESDSGSGTIVAVMDKGETVYVKQGCFTRLQGMLAENINILVGVLAGIAFIMVLGMVFSMCLCRRIRSEYDDYCEE